MKDELIIHIGLGKAASSSLQAEVFLNFTTAGVLPYKQ